VLSVPFGKRKVKGGSLYGETRKCLLIENFEIRGRAQARWKGRESQIGKQRCSWEREAEIFTLSGKERRVLLKRAPSWKGKNARFHKLRCGEKVSRKLLIYPFVES